MDEIKEGKPVMGFIRVKTKEGLEVEASGEQSWVIAQADRLINRFKPKDKK